MCGLNGLSQGKAILEVCRILDFQVGIALLQSELLAGC